MRARVICSRMICPRHVSPRIPGKTVTRPSRSSDSRAPAPPPPIASFHGTQEESQLFSGVHGYVYLRDLRTDQGELGQYASRAASKLSYLSQQRSHRQGSFKDADKEEGGSKPTNMTVRVGPDAFASQFTTESGKIMTNIFPKLSLRYSNGLSTSYHMHARNIKPAGSLRSRPGSICFNTGMCLFSESLVSSLRNREDATTRDEWTLYELETMIRLSSMVADAVGFQGRG